MKLIIHKTDSKWCSIEVSKFEALKLIQSLTNQLVADDLNVGRWESRCHGDAASMTILVGGPT